MIRFFFTILILTFSSAISAKPNWQIKSVKENFWVESSYSYPTDTEIEFSNGHIAKTEIIEFELLDLITSDSGVVFIMFKGRGCSECDMRTSLYINAINQKKYADNKRYGLPGKLLDVYSGKLIEESRLFYGKCLDGKSNTIVWFSVYLGNDEKWHQGVYDVDFNDAETIRNPTSLDYSLISQTEEYVSKGVCREVRGTERTTEP